MNPIIDFLVEDKVLDDEKEAKKIRRVASRYWLSANRKLYRRSFGGPYLLCLHPEKVNELLSELQDGVCGGHVRGHSLAHRAMTLKDFGGRRCRRMQRNMSGNVNNVKNTLL